MKPFKIVTTPTQFRGRDLPFGACYGTFPVFWREYYTAYGKDGKVYKKFHVKKQYVTYYCDDYSIRFNALYIHVWNEKREKWVTTDTGTWKPYNQLRDFIIEQCEKAEAELGFTYEVSAHICAKDARTVGAPRMRKVPATHDMIGKIPNVGYVLNSRVITDDINAPRRVYVKHTHWA